MSTNSPAGQSSANNKNNKTIIIGLSGPSSSGKTTLARLLRPIFAVENKVRTFIIHEDDFYRPDDQIPVVRTKKGDLVQDWDTIGAINVDFLSSALAYVREHGTLPPRLRSKEDQNEAKDPGVAKDLIQKLTEEVSQRMKETLLKDEEEGEGGEVTIAFLEGFLLFAPLATESPAHVLRHVHDGIHLHIFLSAPYDTVKIRREARSGYVTIGPAPTPTAERESNEENNNDNKDKGQSSVIDLEKEDESAPQDFWTDPPGYVDDIVWPRYVQDHAWLLVAEDDETGQQSLAARYAAGSTKTQEELLRLAGQAVNVRSDAGVVVAPGKGGRPMSEILRWAVDEILNYLKV